MRFPLSSVALLRPLQPWVLWMAMGLMIGVLSTPQGGAIAKLTSPGWAGGKLLRGDRPFNDIQAASPPSTITLRLPQRQLGTIAAAPASTLDSGGSLHQAAKPNSSGDTTLVRVLGLKIGRVVIDPGHGGYDNGSVGHGGLLEKELVLDVARKLGALIEQRLGGEVIYTRTDDSFLSLSSRTAVANEKKADLFLSIHANASPYSKASGVETYYLNFTSSRDALELASRENAGSEKTIQDSEELIQKIMRNDMAEESKEFATKVQAALYSAQLQSNAAARNRGVKKAPFMVLVGANMPSMLAEIGFLSNSREEILLKRPEYRQRLAEALYRGLLGYAETLSHFQVAAAKPGAAAGRRGADPRSAWVPSDTH